MANPYIWGDLDRATNDNTKIDQAIDEAIIAHNDDPDAHLGADQALESHRASEIIDHRAESVVNDKIATIARAYVAIVDPASDVDFDTIESAVEYATDKGGGTIFLAPGHHYLSGVVDVPMNINFYAADYESCTIHGNYTAGDYMYIVASDGVEQELMTFENITFDDDGGGIINTDGATFGTIYTLEFTRCLFLGGGKYLETRSLQLRFNRCIIQYGTGPAIVATWPVYFFECQMSNVPGGSNSVLVYFTENGYTECAIWMYDSVVSGTNTTVNPLFTGDVDFSVNLFSSRITNWDYQNAGLWTFNMQSCIISGRANRIYTIQDDGNEGVISFNSIYAGGTGYVQINADTVKFVGNYFFGARGHVSSGAQYYLDMDTLQKNNAGGTTTALDLGRNRVMEYTPNANRTLTTTVPVASEMRTIIFITSGTTSYTMTFGSGFKTTGTLATGAVSARRFVVNFISDGTQLIEMSRTTAIT